MVLTKVAEITEFENTDRVLVTVDGAEIGVIKIGNEYYALRNVCPHQYGPVAEGKVQQKVVADVPPVGEQFSERYAKGEWIIRCPCHAWGFNIKTGENFGDPDNAPSVQVYDTEVKDGSIYVEI